MEEALIAAGALAAAGGLMLVRARFWPYGPCPRCGGRRGRGVGSTGKAYSRCGKCGGSGERVRPVSRVYKVWRDEDRARKKR